MKKHNFYAGPSILSEYTIKNTADAILNFADTGLSILEVSHRSKEFQAVIDEAAALVKELLNVPQGYSVLFLGGGASMQFCMIPYNFLHNKAAYLDTGTWASNAIKEAKLFGEVDVVASSKDANYTYIPKDFTVPADVDYFHFTTNNTIYGTEIRHDPDLGVRLIADMSSDIFSRPIDVAKYDAIYAGAQKNLAPAGVTIVIVKDEALNMKKRFADERRTEIAAISGEVDIEDLIPKEECVLTLTNYGYVKRQKMDTYHTQKRGGRGVAGMNRRDEDVATELFVTGSHDYVMFFSDLGRVYKLKCYEVPEGSRQSRGMNIKNLLPLQPDEKITSMIRVTEFDEDKFLVMVTKNGIIKRTRLSAYDTARKGGLIAIDLANRQGLSPMMVMQNLYVVKG